MSREIKFRYFYSGKMIDVGQLDFFTDGSIHVNGELVGGKLMQFTGLLDKQGKEIYEGDIFGGILETGVVVWDQNRGGWAIEFNSDPELRNEVHWDELEDIKDLKVIGNIYENPALLT